MSKQDSENSVIGEGSVFEGQFFIDGNLRIDGKFEGDIKTKETLYVGPQGKVKTNTIEAKQVRLSGTMIGNIEASEEVNLTESGRLLGNITSPTVNLADGVVIHGAVNITGGHKKDLKKLITDSFDLGHEPKKEQENKNNVS